MSSIYGKKVICREHRFIVKLVQTTYKPPSKYDIEEINKDSLIILLHYLFDYDESFMRDRIN